MYSINSEECMQRKMTCDRLAAQARISNTFKLAYEKIHLG